MGENVMRLWCPHCDESKRCASPGVSHLLHLLLSLLTVGFWIPVWMLVANGQQFRCSDCGSLAKYSERTHLKREARREKRLARKRSRRSPAEDRADDAIPPKPSALRESEYAEWMRKYGGRDR